MNKKFSFICISLLILILFLFISSCAGENTRSEDFPSEDDRSSDSNREIVEPDIYRIKDDTLYIANVYKGLIAVNISESSKPSTKSYLRLNGVPKEMYFKGEATTIMLLESNMSSQYNRNYHYGQENQKSKVSFVDTSDKNNMKLKKEIKIKGVIVDSRVVGDVLYIVTNDYKYEYTKYNYYSHRTDILRTNHITSINLNTMEQIDQFLVKGSSPAIHVTKNNIYIASFDTNYWTTNSTTITRYDISNPDGKVIKKENIEVTGTVFDRFKLNEHNGYLRVVAYDWRKRVTKLHSIRWKSDEENPELKHTLPLAEGESLYATRFRGEVGYIVTFLQKDPLFIIDFSNPDKPVIASAMKDIPGWSDHIEVLDGRLFALGRDGWRVKVAYFDVEDPYNPKEIKTVFLGGESSYTYSNASWDYKRINYLPDLSCFAIPIMSYGDRKYHSRVELIKVTPDNISSFAILEHKGQVKRTIPIKPEIIYTYSDNWINSYQITKDGYATLTKELELAENIVNLARLNDEIGIKFVGTSYYNYYYYNYYYGDYGMEIRTFYTDKYDDEEYLGKVTLDQNTYYYPKFSLVKDNYLYIMGYYSSGYIVEAINLNDPENPEVEGRSLSIPYRSGGRHMYSTYRNRSGSLIYLLNDNIIAVSNYYNLHFLSIENRNSPRLLKSFTATLLETEHRVINSVLFDEKRLYIFEAQENFFSTYNKYNFDIYAYVFDISTLDKEPKLLFKQKVDGFPISVIEGGILLTGHRIKTLLGGTKDRLHTYKIKDNKLEKIKTEKLDNTIYTYIYSKKNYTLWNHYSDDYKTMIIYYTGYDANGNMFTAKLNEIPPHTYITFTLKQDNKLMFTTTEGNLYTFQIGDSSIEDLGMKEAFFYPYSNGVVIGKYLYQCAGYFGIHLTKLPDYD
jgi:hypothetical protein